METVFRAVLLALALSLVACATSDASAAEDLGGVIPAGTRVLAVSRADVDADGRPDVVAVIEHGNVDGPGPQRSRSLVVYVPDGDGLRLAARNDRIVPCGTCGGTLGEPSLYLDSEPGSFTLRTEGGSGSLWSNEYVFEFAGDGRWLLQSITHVTSSRTSNETDQSRLASDDFGRIDFVEFDPEVVQAPTRRGQ